MCFVHRFTSFWFDQNKVFYVRPYAILALNEYDVIGRTDISACGRFGFINTDSLVVPNAVVTHGAHGGQHFSTLL